MKSIHYWELIYTKVKFNLKAEAGNTYLSYLWWLLEPALFIGTFYLVFAVFMNRGGPDFVAFLCCGHIPFQWFSKTISNNCGSIVGGKGLMNQISIPKIFFPTVVIFQDLFKSFIVFALLVLLVLLFGFEPNLSWVSIPFIMLCQLVFISAISIYVAMIVPFIPDMRFIVSTFVMMMMFGSGIFYNYEDVILEEHRDLFLMNPMANLIRSYREVLLQGLWPDWQSLITMAIVCLFFLIIAIVLLKRIDALYPRLVLE